MQYLGKILPIDGYQVELNANMPVDYTEALIHLYQPLTGIDAIHLYQLLLQELKLQKEVHIQAHHGLMNHLNKPLDQIYQARVKLEAIGLMQTYKNETEDKTIYTYVLIPPFRPPVFFADMMLSELLYRQIGKRKFMLLKNLYTNTSIPDKGENITVSFNDVFTTITPDASLKITPLKEQVQTGIPIDSMDFKMLAQALEKSMIPVEKVLTELNRRIINQLAVMYELENYEIEKALMWALTDENELDVEQFKAACQDFFASKENVLSSEQNNNIQKAPTSGEPNKNKRLENLIQRLEHITPKQLLEDLSQGGNASAQDMEMISDISTKQGVPNPVLNVAINYVMLKSNKQLPKHYLEKIVSHWSRLGYTTARQAVEHVQQNMLQQQAKKQKHSTKRTTKEVIPEWFNKRKEQPKKNSSEQPVEDTLGEKERQELEALLRRHTSKNN